MEKKEEIIEEQEKRTFGQKIKTIIIFIIIILVALVLWARYISTSGLIVKEYNITNDKIPQSYHGTKIIHFSDLHYGNSIDEKYLKNLVNKINDLKPDIVFFTGDLIDKGTILKDEERQNIGKTLKSIDPEIEKYAITGNHDYVDEDFDTIMETAEFTILTNENKSIYYKGDIPLKIVGLPSIIQDHHEYEKAFSEETDEKTNHYTILLAHEPDVIANVADYDIDLMLSGHSHGGQVRLPFVGGIIKNKYAKKYSDEYYKIDETKLFVSSGIGTSELPFRFLNKPSINLYRLYKN